MKQRVVSLKVKEIIDAKLRKSVEQALSAWSSKMSSGTLMSKFTEAQVPQEPGHARTSRNGFAIKPVPMQQPETLSELSRYRTETESDAPSTFSEKEKVQGSPEKFP